MTTQDSSPLFLGFDLSTQGLKAVVISDEGIVVNEAVVQFDRDLPNYNTVNGALRGPEPGEVTSPVRMWLEAFDVLMSRLTVTGVQLNRVLGISGDGQVRSRAACLHLNNLTFP